MELYADLDLAERVIALEILVMHLASRIPEPERGEAFAAVNHSDPPALVGVPAADRPGVLQNARTYARTLLGPTQL